VFSTAGSSTTTTNVLVGGPGGSALTGGAGRDILIGGGAAATLTAGSGDDILIAGTTRYNNKLAALAAIMTEWGRTDLTYEQRVQDLFGKGTDGYTGPLLNAQSVARDTAISQLVGGTSGGLDWFWFAQNAKLTDKLGDYSTGETATFE
jgi:Ca2+-binding RTX toxin-like protein